MRDALLEQLAYLCEEIRMLRPMAIALPVELLEARRTESSASLKEIYAELLIATEVAAQQSPESLQAIDEAEAIVAAANQDMSEILDRLVESRSHLVSQLGEQPPADWEGDGAARVLAIRLAALDLKLQQAAAETLAEWSPMHQG